MRSLSLIAAAMILIGAADPAAIPSPGEIVAAAPADAWRAIAPDDLLVMTLADGRRIAIELAPGFAPVHVANIRALARAGWFAGTSINRVQDNYVVQWGDASEAKPLPADIVATPPPEYERALAGIDFTGLPVRDAYAARVGIGDGWPVASERDRAWLAHCYGMVGVGRGMPPDTGTGAELYVVSGHAPRHLDRNIALVGRVVDGIEALTALPRGGEALGFYGDPKQRVEIASIALAATLPEASRPRYEVLRTDSKTWRQYVDARMNRRDAFFVRPAGGADLCNVPVPVRRAK